MYKTLKLESKGGITTLTLNVPEKRNAQTPELTREFPLAIEEINNDPDVKLVIITGSGKAFCAGGDLQMLEDKLDQPPEQNRREMLAFYKAYLSVLTLDVPCIAAINGFAIGAGLSFALGCDIRIAAEEAKLGFTFLNLGLHPGMGTTYLLPQLIGTAHAAELVFTGKLITAEEGCRMGLVNKTVPLKDLMDTVMETASLIAVKPASALRMTKKAMVKYKLRYLEEALDYEANAQMLGYASQEMRDLINSYKAK
ncbi:MAG: enoyl-CoA hydratase/isomerase family protein [Bacillota bacterium]|nr:enoyl-CoA hydratase/isomerase family protein [Bacillota bacterium]MDW7683566.1 enoyl-CoA hydratase/isomerase family protein [Bacillota bacterium]